MTLTQQTTFATMSDKFVALASLGFTNLKWGTVTRPDIQQLFQTESTLREGLDFDIDGLVFAVNDLAVQTDMGFTTGKRRCPKGQCALKFPAAGEIVTIQAIETSADGAAHLSPVAIYEPTEMAGATCTRASLKSFRWLTDRAARIAHRRTQLLKQGYTAALASSLASSESGQFECVGVGSKIYVARAGDVIPTVIKVVSNSETDQPCLPTSCPKCSGGIVWNGAYLDCANNECPGKLAAHMRKFLVALGVKGLGQDSLVVYAEAGVTMFDFFRRDGFVTVEQKLQTARQAGTKVSLAIWAKIKRQLLALPPRPC